MDPVSLGVSVVGLGMSIYGGFKQSADAQQEAKISQEITGAQQQQNDIRKQQMELSSSRSQLENVRTAQRARSMATMSAVSQGAQFGSGLQGGLAQVSDAASWQNQGIVQNTQLGEGMFGLQNQISGYQSQMASLKGQEATDAGWASLGGSLMKSAGPLGNLTKTGFGAVKGMNLGSGLMGGGSPSGYGS